MGSTEGLADDQVRTIVHLLADVAIVAGVIGLLYESFVRGGVPQKRPDPP